MQARSAIAVSKKLNDLLETERKALIAGDLDAISSMIEEKGDLIETLHDLDPLARPSLEELQDKIVRNQALLDSALQGIRKVASRIAALRKARKALETYDARGHIRTIEGEVVRIIERRA